MSNAIHRIQLPIVGYQEIGLTGQPLSVAADRGGESTVFDLWFEHMDEGMYATEQHHAYPIWVLGTGNPVPWLADTRTKFRFLGTFATPVGQVWHVYTDLVLGVQAPT